jgi:DNA-binding transcriptional regulator GbsR (MarR family)
MKKRKNALGEEKLRAVEKRLAGIIADLGYFRGRSPKVSKVLAYIYIRREASQHLLRELTGYSLGTISIALRELEKSGVVSKYYSPDTHRHLYKFDGTPLQALSRSMTSFPTYLSQIAEFLEEIEKELGRPSLSKKRGYKNVRRFLDEMNVLIPAYKNVLQKFQTMNLNVNKEMGGVTNDA